MKHFFCVLSALLLFIFALPGGEQKTNAPPAKGRPFHGTIKTVNKPAQSIVLNGAKAQTFKVTPETKIRRDGKPIRFEEIIAGETVGGYAHQVASNHWQAVTINLGQKTPEPSGSTAPPPAPKPMPKQKPK
jgi:hypothetical protein